jgi:glutaredoxin
VGIKEFLEDNQVDYLEKLIDEDEEARVYMKEVLKADNIPVTVIGDKVFVGFRRNVEAIKAELGLK